MTEECGTPGKARRSARLPPRLERYHPSLAGWVRPQPPPERRAPPQERDERERDAGPGHRRVPGEGEDGERGAREEEEPTLTALRGHGRRGEPEMTANDRMSRRRQGFPTSASNLGTPFVDDQATTSWSRGGSSRPARGPEQRLVRQAHGSAAESGGSAAARGAAPGEITRWGVPSRPPRVRSSRAPAAQLAPPPALGRLRKPPSSGTEAFVQRRLGWSGRSRRSAASSSRACFSAADAFAGSPIRP
jgi:hypothetical protein